MLTELLTKNRSLFVEVRERILISSYIFSCDVGVNLSHSSAVRPSADFLCNLLWDLEMVGQRGETVAESVDGYISKVVGLAYSVNLAQEVGAAASHDWARRFPLLVDQFFKFWNEDRNIAGRKNVFVLLLAGHYVVLVWNDGAIGSDEVRILFDARPI